MKINLSKSVQLKELCKISAIGNTKYKAKRIEFTFSREAILGFTTELLWLYDVIEGKQLTISTYQLKVDPAPSQALVRANNCKEGDAYLLSHMCEIDCQECVKS